MVFKRQIFPFILLAEARNLLQDARNLLQDAPNLLQDACNLAQDARTTVSVAQPNLKNDILLFNRQIFPIILFFSTPIFFE